MLKTLLSTTFLGLIFISTSAHAEDQLIERVLNKIEAVASSSSESSSQAKNALEAFKNVKAQNEGKFQKFVEQIKNFRHLVKHNAEYKDVIKGTRKACRKDPSSDECIAYRNKMMSLFSTSFDSAMVRMSSNELFRDTFIGINGYKMWGESINYQMWGVGLEFARSIFNIGACMIPNLNSVEAFNIGVVASAVLGAGVTTGVYVGTNGVCFDFGLMYGVGAYAAISTYELSDRSVGRGMQSQCQKQIQLGGSEGTDFPRQIGAVSLDDRIKNEFKK